MEFLGIFEIWSLLKISKFCNFWQFILLTWLWDYFQRRSLRERKKKTYKDDFDYNLSEEEGEKETAEGGVPATFPGDSTGQAHIPMGPEVEETTTVEKILAMRTKQVRRLWLIHRYNLIVKYCKAKIWFLKTFLGFYLKIGIFSLQDEEFGSYEEFLVKFKN